MFLIAKSQFRFCHCIFICLLVFSSWALPPVYANDTVLGVASLPAPGKMVHLSPQFNPPILKGIKVHPDNPFRFDFVLDQGEKLGTATDFDLKQESTKLIKYFLASLTVPEKDLWVNLSPYEKDRIIPNEFGQTEMGRDLLAQDYILKQITASLIYPEDEIGKKFWKRIYEEAQAKYHTTNIPINTFNKVWIIPEKAVVYENANAGTAYVVESKLKVMLEQDYLSLQKHEGTTLVQGQETNQLGSQIVREIVIPELTKEINEGMNFSQLRQVYNSLILATWYKKKIKNSILEQVYVDKNKVSGVNVDDPQEKEKIYQQYLKAFKKGVYSYIKEEFDPLTQEAMPRKYFSGGFDLAMTVHLDSRTSIDTAQLGSQKGLIEEEVRLDRAMAGIEKRQTKIDRSNKSDNNFFEELKDKDYQRIFAIWLKGKAYQNELIFEARKFGFTGLVFDGREKPLPGVIRAKGNFIQWASYHPPLVYKPVKKVNSYQEAYLNYWDIYENSISHNFETHANRQGIFLWRETLLGYEFFSFDYGTGVITPEGAPQFELEKIFSAHSYRKKTANSGLGLGLAYVGMSSYLTRVISVNGGYIHVVDKYPGMTESSGGSLFEYSVGAGQSNFRTTGKTTGFIIHGFVPILPDQYKGVFASPTQQNILGTIKTERSKQEYHGSWQYDLPSGLEGLRPGDNVNFIFYATGDRVTQSENYYGSIRLRHEIVDLRKEHEGVLKEIPSADNQGLFIFKDGFKIGINEVKEFKKGVKEKNGVKTGSENKTKPVDDAMTAQKSTGGIDLTPANMNLKIQNVSEGIKFHLDPAQLQQLQNVPGFMPVIINIQPIKDVSYFLGLN